LASDALINVLASDSNGNRPLWMLQPTNSNLNPVKYRTSSNTIWAPSSFGAYPCIKIVTKLPPSFNTTNTFTVYEKQKLVGTVSATDIDGDDITYTVTDDELTINNDGELRFINTPDFEKKSLYTAIITATVDNISSYLNIIININKLDDIHEDIYNDDSPKFISNNVFNTSKFDSSIGTVVINNLDYNNITFMVTGDKLSINNSGVLSIINSNDYTKRTTYNEIVTVKSDDKLFTQNIIVNILGNELIVYDDCKFLYNFWNVPNDGLHLSSRFMSQWVDSPNVNGVSFFHSGDHRYNLPRIPSAASDNKGPYHWSPRLRDDIPAWRLPIENLRSHTINPFKENHVDLSSAGKKYGLNNFWWERMNVIKRINPDLRFINGDITYDDAFSAGITDFNMFRFNGGLEKRGSLKSGGFKYYSKSLNFKKIIQNVNNSTRKTIHIFVSQGTLLNPYYTFYTDKYGKNLLSPYNTLYLDTNYEFHRLNDCVSNPFYISDIKNKKPSDKILFDGHGSYTLGIRSI